uniref:Ig-like domain-containing protein n=1 Tax=Periophthalmus magnuspinnatus TaxID=409849 RepID=A0A3B3ZWA4_9GOBI
LTLFDTVNFACCLFLITSSAQMNGLQEKDIFLPAAFGDNIKLSCISSDNVKIGARFSWYRQKLGMKPVLISSYFKYDQKDEFYGEFSRDKRFRLDYENDKHDLHINNVSMSDSAVYHCVKCYLHQIDFLESVTVIVKTLEPTIEVRQSAHEEIEPGHSVILNCSVQTESCEGPHRVHWFKQFVESAAGVLYSHGGGNMHDGCKNKGKSPTNFCVYNLPIHNVSSEQTGTYYCAVAACGQVLFGNGTQITIKGEFYYFIIEPLAALRSHTNEFISPFSQIKEESRVHLYSAQPLRVGVHSGKREGRVPAPSGRGQIPVPA